MKTYVRLTCLVVAIALFALAGCKQSEEPAPPTQGPNAVPSPAMPAPPAAPVTPETNAPAIPEGNLPGR